MTPCAWPVSQTTRSCACSPLSPINWKKNFMSLSVQIIHESVTSQSARSIQVVSLITMMAERLGLMSEWMKYRLKLIDWLHNRWTARCRSLFWLFEIEKGNKENQPYYNNSVVLPLFFQSGVKINSNRKSLFRVYWKTPPSSFYRNCDPTSGGEAVNVWMINSITQVSHRRSFNLIATQF